MRRFIAIIVVLTGCFLLALWSPWLQWNISLNDVFNVEEPESIAGLYVYSLSGTLEVQVDGESQGVVTPEDSPLILDTITPGDRLVTITRSALIDTSYWTFNELITFTEGVNVVISYNIGPTEEFSEGNIVSAVEKPLDQELNEITIQVNTEDAFVTLDNTPVQEINPTSFRELIDLSTQHEITVSKPGFETFTFTVLPDTQEERDDLQNFNFVVNVQLLQIPVQLEEV